ncbi:MAG: hypothetical protein JRI72_00505 [Deltaproteobacteria bacterium]|nr:hypothetical protein [Deltaproteobacteria bacterium]
MEEGNETKELQGEVAPEVAPEIIERAKTMGWIPEEEFKGDKSRWRTAEEYVKRADELMPIMRSQMSKYESEIMNLKSTIESQKETTEKLLKMSEKISQKEYEKAKLELKKQQMEAVAEGNTEKWAELEEKKEALQPPEPIKVKEPENAKAQTPAQFAEWHRNNDWYLKDEDLTLFANSYLNVIDQESPDMPYEQVLKTVEQKVKDAFPHKFSNPNREKASMVDSSTQRATQTKPKSKTYNDLPADAKAQCDIWVNEGLFKSKEDYVKSYFEEE